MKCKRLIGMLAVAGLVAPGVASATNGYFSHGYGMKAKAMGGAATALAIDAFGGANNPASMVWVGNRLDLGIDWFSPIRSASRAGSVAAVDFAENSSSDNFFIPEFGYNRMLNPDMSVGLTVYGNGGMNTDYHSGTSVASCAGFGSAGPHNPLCGVGELGVNLEQLVIAPTFAYKVNPSHSLGISPLFGYQRFRANGLQAFMQISSDPANLTNNGYDHAQGWGVRIGWQGKVSDTVTLGAAYSSKIDMSKFDKYRGLFAEQGDFDIPENYNIGVAFAASPALTVALDYQRINYNKVKSVGNSSTTLGCTPAPPFGPGAGAGCLGGSAGIGFGWSNVNVVKVGLQYQYNDKMMLRAGYDRSTNPIGSGDVTFNILAPGVVQDHYTIGLGYAVNKDSEITVSYMHAAEKSVSGTPNPVYFPAGGTETIKMYQNSLGIAYGWKM